MQYKTMLTTISNFMKTTLWLILTAVTVLLVWKTMVPPAPSIPPERLKAADDAAAQFVDDLRAIRGNAKSAVVLHLANDPTHCLTHAIRRRIRETGVLSLANPTCKERFMTAFNLDFDCCATENEAQHIAEGAPQDLLVWGVIDRFETDEQGKPVITGELNVIDVVTLKPIFTRKFAPPPKKEGARLLGIDTTQLASPMLPARLATFLLLVVLLGGVSFPAIRKLVAKRSNSTNLALLIGFTAVDTALAAVIFSVPTVIPAFPWLLSVAAVASVFFNLMVLSHATKLEA